MRSGAALGGVVHRHRVQARAPTARRSGGRRRSGARSGTVTTARSRSGTSVIVTAPDASAASLAVQGRVLLGPQVAEALGAVAELGQPAEQLAVEQRPSGVVVGGQIAAAGSAPGRRRPRAPWRSGPPSRDDGHGEVAGPRHLDEQVAPRQRLVGRARARTRRPARPGRSGCSTPPRRPRGGRTRRGSAKAISADRSAANSGGLPMPGQCDRQSTVPSAGDPSTTTLGAPAQLAVGDVVQVGGAGAHAGERTGAATEPGSSGGRLSRCRRTARAA